MAKGFSFQDDSVNVAGCASLKVLKWLCEEKRIGDKFTSTVFEFALGSESEPDCLERVEYIYNRFPHLQPQISYLSSRCFEIAHTTALRYIRKLSTDVSRHFELDFLLSSANGWERPPTVEFLRYLHEISPTGTILVELQMYMLQVYLSADHWKCIIELGYGVKEVLAGEKEFPRCTLLSSSSTTLETIQFLVESCGVSVGTIRAGEDRKMRKDVMLYLRALSQRKEYQRKIKFEWSQRDCKKEMNSLKQFVTLVRSRIITRETQVSRLRSTWHSTPIQSHQLNFFWYLPDKPVI